MAAFVQIDNPQEIQKAYTAMVQMYGKDIFNEPRRALGCMADMAPKLTKEVKDFSAALQNGVPGLLKSGSGKAAVTENAKKAVKLLTQQGMDADDAFGVVENICAALETPVSIRPDYSKGGEIPYEQETGKDIRDAIYKMNHIRWFLNHQEEYSWAEQKDKLSELRRLMNQPLKNRLEIEDKYKKLVHQFSNNPYEDSIILEDSKKKYAFTAGAYDKYFVVIGDMPVAVGFAREYPGSETNRAFQIFLNKKKLFLDKVQRLKQYVENQKTPDADAAKSQVSAGRYFLFFSLLFIALFGYINKDILLFVDYRPLIGFLKAGSRDFLALFRQIWSVPEFRSYALSGLVFLVAAIVIVSLLVSMIRTFIRGREVKKESVSPEKLKKKVIQLLEKEIPAKAEALEKAFQSYWSKSSKSTSLDKKDYRKDLRITSGGNGSGSKMVVSKAGRRLRMLMFLLCVFCFWTVRNGAAMEVAEGSIGMATYINNGLLPAGEAGFGGIGKVINGESGLYENSFADLSQAERVEIADMTQSSFVNTGNGNYTVVSALDSNMETSWQEGVDGDGTGEYILMTFTKPYEVQYLYLQLGSWKREGSFYENNRPSRLHFDLDGQEFYYDFPDEQREFILAFSTPVTAQNLRITIEGTYPGSRWDDTCITAVELYAATESASEAAAMEVFNGEEPLVEAEASGWSGCISREQQEGVITAGTTLSQDEMVKYLLSNNATRAAYVLDVQNMQEYGLENSDTPMPASALISIPILFTIADGIQEGTVDASSMVTYSRTFEGGRGNSQNKQNGLPYAIMDLVDDMLSYSDNNAINSLIDFLGLSRINDTCHKYGFGSVDMQRKLMNAASDLENYVSTKDAAMMLNAIYQNNFERIDRDFLESYFSIEPTDSSNTGMYAAGQSYPVFLNHNGITDTRYNEVGLFGDGNSLFIVSVMTANGNSQNSVAMVRDLTQYIANTL